MQKLACLMIFFRCRKRMLDEYIYNIYIIINNVYIYIYIIWPIADYHNTINMVILGDLWNFNSKRRFLFNIATNEKEI